MTETKDEILGEIKRLTQRAKQSLKGKTGRMPNEQFLRFVYVTSRVWTDGKDVYRGDLKLCTAADENLASHIARELRHGAPGNQCICGKAFQQGEMFFRAHVVNRDELSLAGNWCQDHVGDAVERAKELNIGATRAR